MSPGARRAAPARPGLAWRLQAALVLLAAGQAALAAAPAADCEAMRAAYREALRAAQVCDPKSPAPCSSLRVGALEDACRCAVGVNPERTQALDRLLADYQAQGCAAAPAICNRMCTRPATACTTAPGGPALCGRH